MISWNRFLGSLNVYKFGLCCIHQYSASPESIFLVGILQILAISWDRDTVSLGLTPWKLADPWAKIPWDHHGVPAPRRLQIV